MPPKNSKKNYKKTKGKPNGKNNSVATKQWQNRYKNSIHYFKRDVNAIVLEASGAMTFATSSGTVSSTGNRITWNGAGGVAGTQYMAFGAQFSLLDLPAYQDFQNLYDVYRIVGVRMELRTFPMSAQQQTYFINGLVVHYAPDRDDSNTPLASEVGVNVLRQKYGYRRKILNTTIGTLFKAYYAPSVAVDVFNAAVGSAYTAMSGKKTWLDNTTPDIAHYGMKAILEYPTVSTETATIPFSITFTYYLQFKDRG